MSPKRVELYEIIANQLNEGESPAEPPLGTTYEIPLSNRAGRRKEREVVLSLDAGFVIFVIFLLLLGTSYFLGLQKGMQKERESFTTRTAEKPPMAVNLDTLRLPNAKEAPITVPAAETSIPRDKYTLMLYDSDNKEEILRLRDELRADELIRKQGVEVMAFAQNGKNVFFLTLGLATTATDETLALFRKYFTDKERFGGKKYDFRLSEELIADIDGRLIP